MKYFFVAENIERQQNKISMKKIPEKMIRARKREAQNMRLRAGVLNRLGFELWLAKLMLKYWKLKRRFSTLFRFKA